MGKVKLYQIGKQGLTEGFIENLKKDFKKSKFARISVLRSARENGKEDVKKIAEDILKSLGDNYKFRIIGFVIVLRKFSNPKSFK